MQNIQVSGTVASTCIESQDHILSTTYVNICTGVSTNVRNGDLDSIAIVGVLVLGVIAVALLCVAASKLLID